MFKIYLFIAVIAILFASSRQIRIPLKMLKALSEIGDPDEFEKKFLLPSEEDFNVTEANRTLIGSGRSVPLTKNTLNLSPSDPCSIRPTSVTIPPDSDPSIVFWPSCTKIKRCGGCCGSEVYECAPTKTSYDFVTVRVSRYPFEGSQYFERMGTRTIPIVQHLECEAQCRVKSHHCSKYQKYSQDDCSCMCLYQQQQCDASKRWDQQRCRCVCNKVEKCDNEDLTFSHTTCRCELRDLISGGVDIDKLRKVVKTDKSSGGKGSVPDIPGGYDKNQKESGKPQPVDTKSKTMDTKTPKPAVVVPDQSSNSGKAAKKVDCSGKDCPPMWVGFEESPGVCSCKMNFG